MAHVSVGSDVVAALQQFAALRIHEAIEITTPCPRCRSPLWTRYEPKGARMPQPGQHLLDFVVAAFCLGDGCDFTATTNGTFTLRA